MKTLRIFPCLLVICFSLTFAQGQVYNGNLTLTNQQQVDTFSYQEITGYLAISGTITNLDGMSSLKRIGDYLEISDSDSTLLSFSGLNSLTSIGGRVYISDLPMLQSINGLNSLVSIGDELRISNADNLQSINGLSNLSHVLGRFMISHNPILQSIQGFGNLKNTGAFSLINLPQLDDISGFSALDSTRGLSILVTGLQNLNAFKNLTYLQYGLNIRHNPHLTNIDSLINLKYIGAGVQVGGNDSLVSLNGLNGLTQLTCDILLDSNPLLTDISFLSKHKTLDGDIELQNLPSLISLNGMMGLEVISGKFEMINLSITDLSGLTGLTYSGTLELNGCDSLLSLSGVDSLTHIGIGSSEENGLRIISCNRLTSLDGLQSLKHTSNVSVFSNLNLQTIDFLNGLQSSVYGVQIKANPVLLEIGGFEALESCTKKGLDIQYNPKLIAVKGFSQLSHLPLPSWISIIPIEIKNNPFLSSLCGLYHYFQKNPGYIYYSYNITNNAPGISFQDAIGLGPCGVYNYPVSGSVYHDIDQDCIRDTTETNLANWTVVAQPGAHYAITDSLGNFTLKLDSGAYSLSVVGSMLSPSFQQFITSCDSATQIFVDIDSIPMMIPPIGVDIPNCPHVVTSFGNVILRRCFDRAITIKYENLGNAPANQAVLVFRKPKLLQIFGSSAPFTYGIDSVLIFQIGTIPPGGKGSITVQTKIPCTNIEHLGIEQCLESWIETPGHCQQAAPNWSGATLEARSSCSGDSLLIMEIRNDGSGPMTDSTTYRLYADTLLVQAGNILLDTINSFLITIPADNRTYRLETGQALNHPSPGLIATALEGCYSPLNSTTSRGMISIFPPPSSRAQPSYSSICRPIIGSYDPNDKKVTPSGFGPQHLVIPGSELTYRIRFQNTGTDTAFTIHIVDTLAQALDPATFSPVSASHPFVTSFSGDSNTVVTFLFNNILLPDSNVNEPASHGYIEFTISPNSTALAGTSISNFADIYFDYNPPIRTDTTTTNFGIYQLPSLLNPRNSPYALSTLPHFKIHPNPFIEYVIIKNEGFLTQGQLLVINALGETVSVNTMTFPKELKVNMQELPVGTYFIQVVLAEGSRSWKVQKR